MIPHRFASHLPALEWAVDNTSGPILEMGGGAYSTPYLVSTGRPLTTVETDEEWRSDIMGWFPRLDLRYEPPEQEWGVVFIDNEPETERRQVLDSFDGRYSVAVVHDVWPKGDPAQRYPTLWESVTAPHWWFVPPAELGPPTLVVSEWFPETLPDGEVVLP